MVTITGKFSTMVTMPKTDNAVAVDEETLFVAEINGQHVQIKRIFSPEKKRIIDERPVIGKTYPALISYLAGIPTVYTQATVNDIFNDDGARFATISVPDPIKNILRINISLAAIHAKLTPGFTLPDKYSLA